MYSEMGNDEDTELQLKPQDSPNRSGFLTTPKVGRTGLNLTAGNHVVLTQQFWVLDKQWQAFAWVVRQGQNRVLQT
jgi:SNF2 family DNA or RNA helicase